MTFISNHQTFCVKFTQERDFPIFSPFFNIMFFTSLAVLVSVTCLIYVETQLYGCVFS